MADGKMTYEGLLNRAVLTAFTIALIVWILGNPIRALFAPYPTASPASRPTNAP